MGVRVNFETDMQEAVLRDLPYLKVDQRTVDELRQKDITELLTIYFNWRSRFIPTRPRQVQRSAKLKQQSGIYSDALSQIEEAFVKGDDLTPRLSKLVSQNGYVVGSSSAPKDKDLMLNDWGVHHLHLGLKLETNGSGFIERSGDLLFVKITPTTAYMIGIFDHKSWSASDVLKALAAEWPSQTIILEGDRVKGLRVNYSDADAAALRAAGISTLRDVGGRIVGGHITTSRDSRRTYEIVRRVVESANKYSNAARAGTLGNDRSITKFINHPSANDLCFDLRDNLFGVRSISGGGFAPLVDTADI